MSAAKNVLRTKQKGFKWFFCTLIILFIFFIESLIAYNYLCYLHANADSDNPNIYAFVLSLVGFMTYAKIPLNPKTLIDILRCIGAVWYVNIIILCFLLFSMHRKRNFAGVEHGSARWASYSEKRAFKHCETAGLIPLADNISVHPENNELNNLNELVVGGSGSGKSFTKLIPDIMYQFGSYIITDVKGDLYKFLYKILKKNGYKVRVLNLENLKYSNCFNPISYCENNIDVDKLVNTFVINSRKEGAQTGEAFWEDTLSMLLTAAILYILDTPEEEKTFYRCLCLAASVEIVNGKVSPYCEIERAMQRTEIENPYSPAVLNWRLVKQAAPETLQSVVISLTSRLRLWANEDLQILTQKDEMDFDSLAEEKTAIFLIVPEGDRTYQAISSMFISTAVNRLKTIAKNKYNGSLPMMVSFELDEFANTGILPNWADTVSSIRSQNIRALMIIQDLQQLKKNYDKSEKTIMSNCAIFNYLGTSDTETNKMISERLGKTTIFGNDISYQTGMSGQGHINERATGRSLLTADEIEHLKKDKSIIIISNYYPIFAKKFRTDKHPLFDLLGNNTGSHVKNNTDIAEQYEKLYDEHYKDFMNIRNKPKVDVFEEAESARARQNKPEFSEIATDEKEQPAENSNPEQIKNEFERSFLDNLKALNK